MARHEDDEVVYVREGGASGLKWFLAGAVIGGGLALLFAPRSGEATRRLLARKARDLRDLAEDGLDELEERFEEGKEKVRERVDEVRGRAADAAEAVRGTGRSAREELERRLAEARVRRRAAAVADDEEPAI